MWKSTLDLMDIHNKLRNDEITPVEYVKEVIVRVENSRFTEYAQEEIIEVFSDIVYHLDATLDDIDDALEVLYDNADGERIWIKTF